MRKEFLLMRLTLVGVIVGLAGMFLSLAFLIVNAFWYDRFLPCSFSLMFMVSAIFLLIQLDYRVKVKFRRIKEQWKEIMEKDTEGNEG